MWLLAQLEGASFIFVSALAITTGWLLLRTHRQLGRQRSAEPRPNRSAQGDPPAAPRRHGAAARELDRWEVEMHELARELSGRLDSKLSILEHLLRDAECLAERLESAIERASRSELLTADRANRPAAVRSITSANTVAQHQAAALTAAARPHSGLAPRDNELPLPVQSSPGRRYDEIYALSDAGQSSAAIASLVGSPVGEVDLILGLRAKQQCDG